MVSKVAAKHRIHPRIPGALRLDAHTSPEDTAKFARREGLYFHMDGVEVFMVFGCSQAQTFEQLTSLSDDLKAAQAAGAA